MRLTIAAVMLMPAAIPASAGSAPALSAAQATDFSATKKARKAKAKPKVEYMRAVPVR